MRCGCGRDVMLQETFQGDVKLAAAFVWGKNPKPFLLFWSCECGRQIRMQAKFLMHIFHFWCTQNIAIVVMWAGIEVLMSVRWCTAIDFFLSSPQKGGALINTAVTKASPAVKTAYKFVRLFFFFFSSYQFFFLFYILDCFTFKALCLVHLGKILCVRAVCFSPFRRPRATRSKESRKWRAGWNKGWAVPVCNFSAYQDRFHMLFYGGCCSTKTEMIRRLITFEPCLVLFRSVHF